MATLYHQVWIIASLKKLYAAVSTDRGIEGWWDKPTRTESENGGHVKHGFTFTPSMSLYVTCETESEIDMLFAELSEGGMVPMPLDAYPFSKSYVWVNDRFGVSWQLGLGNIL